MQEYTHKHTPIAYMDPHIHPLYLTGGSIPLTVTSVSQFETGKRQSTKINIKIIQLRRNILLPFSEALSLARK